LGLAAVVAGHGDSLASTLTARCTPGAATTTASSVMARRSRASHMSPSRGWRG